MKPSKAVDLEDKSISKLIDKIDRDKIIVTVIFVFFATISTISLTVVCYINDIIAFLIAGVMLGQILICFIILWFYTRLILFLKLNLED